MGSTIPPSGSGSGVRTGGDTGLRFRVLPLRLLVAGRFGLAAGRLHRLAEDGVEGLLERTAPTLALRVADRLRADGTELTVRLAFRHRRDFAPGAVARAVPELASVLDAPRVPQPDATPARPDAGVPDPAPAAASPPEAEGSGDDAIDRLLDMVEAPPPARPDAPAPSSDPARAILSGFIAEVTRGSGRPAESAAQAGSDREPLLAEQIAAIVDHPDFRALERAWAALRFLARRVDRRAAVTVEVVEADADAVAETLEGLVPEDGADPAGPVRLVVDLNDYDASDRDVARLRRLAGFGASRRAVVLANADPGFAGAGGPEALAAMHDPETRFEEPSHAGWRTLRDAPESGRLGLCLSRLALRDGHDGRDDKALGFTSARRIGRVLDAGAAPAVAALFAAASAAGDWACAVGTAVEPVVENLVLPEGRDDGFKGPVRPALSVSAADSLASAGLIVLVPEPGRDTARLLRVPSARRGADASLTTRLFQDQVVHGLQWNADQLFSAADPQTLRTRVEAYLTALLGGTGPEARVQVTLDGDEDGSPVLAIEVRSGSRAAPGAAMAFDIPIEPDTGDPDREA